MALPLANTAEGGSSGTTVSTGNSGGSSGSAWDAVDTPGTGGVIAYDNAHAAHGTIAYKFVSPNPTATQRIRWTTSPGSFSEIWGRAYVYCTAAPSSSLQLIRINNGSQTRQATVLLGTDQKLHPSDSASVQANGTVSYNLSAWFRIEFHFLGNSSTGVIEAKLFNTADSSSASETVTRSSANTDTGSGAAQVEFGIGSAGNAGYTFWLDDLQINASGYPGPASATGATSKDVALRWEIMGAPVANLLGEIPATTPVPRVWQSADPPGVFNDASTGAAIGDVWINTTDSSCYICASSALNAANWKRVTA